MRRRVVLRVGERLCVISGWVGGWVVVVGGHSTRTVARRACWPAYVRVGDFVRANNTLRLQPGSVPAVFVGLQWARAL